MGVVLGLQARLDEVNGVGRPGRQRATEGAGSDIADKGVVVLRCAQESFGGGVAAKPDTCNKECTVLISACRNSSPV